MTKMNIGMLKSLIFPLIFLVIRTNAQELSSVAINWSEPRKFTEAGREKSVLYFEDAYFHNSEIPQKFLKIKGEIENLEFSNLTSVPFTEAEKKLIPAGLRSASPATYLVSGIEGNTIYSYIYVTPVIFNQNTGVPEKIVSFDYRVKYKTVSQFSGSAIGANLRISSANAGNSVLSSGEWYKVSVPSTGIYKIDYNMLKVMGIIPENIDPRKLRIFGNGGGMLPQANSASRNDDLVENAVFVNGENDGVFNDGDYLLFYAQGPHSWKYDQKTGLFRHNYNIYTESNFYFLTVGPGFGLRVSEKPSLQDAAVNFNDFAEYSFKEQDNVSILHSGREWFWDKFDYKNASKEYSFGVDGIVPNSGVKLTASVMGSYNLSSKFQIFANNQSLYKINVPGISDLFSYTYSIKGELVLNTDTIPYGVLIGSDLKVKLQYEAGGNSASGYLNFLEINYRRKLALYGNYTSFRNSSTTKNSTARFNLSQFPGDAVIWDVTDPLKPVKQQYEINGTQATFATETDNQLREYVAFKGNSFPSPVFISQIGNQNLHMSGTPPEFLIIVPDRFLSAAQRLKGHRENYSKMKVTIATVSQIYNEFSSGRPDITGIRDFIRMNYLRSSGNDSLRYVLLFGDCSYDYKDRVENNSNFIPVYESVESLNPVRTYSSDDYYGFMSEPEGDWDELREVVRHTMEIGVGRLVVNNETEADQVVNKIIAYDTDKNNRKKWRNKLCFVADDGDSNLHQGDAEKLSNKVYQNNPVFNINKIYLDAYPQIPAPGGEIAVEAKNLLVQEIEKGVLLVNYTGHGGESGWAQEKLLEISDIQSLRNLENLTFMITATCEFGRYDDPGLSSGAELAVRNPSGGVIGLMTTTRPVLSNSNFLINNSLYNHIFRKNNGKWMCIGEIMKFTKNQGVSDVYNRNYSLLGDPSMILAYPQEEIKVTSINGKDPAVTTDTLRALSKVTIAGEIENGSHILSDFNGTLYATIFDKPSQITTIGNEGPNTTMQFSLFNNYLYDGKASVKDGKFSVTFLVPKDISYQLDKGKISLYAVNDQGYTDAHGYENKVIIGGSSATASADNTPPRMKLFINDESFVNGGAAGNDALLIVKLFDENGINIAGTGIGHEISAILDGEKAVINLNEYYSATVDSYKEGVAEYQFKNLEAGVHTLKVKAWDTYNNSSESIIEFVVLSKEKLELKNILNFPNPFSTSTNFHFDHNRAGDDLDVMVQIYTVSGKLIKTLKEFHPASKSHISSVHWDGRDDFGDLLGKGVYVYKVEIKSVRDGSRTQKYQKLVLLN